MGFLATRAPFNPAGYFTVKKGSATAIGGVPVRPGDVLPPNSLDHLGPRKLQTMYDTRWIDMASDDEIAEYLALIGDSDGVTLLQPRRLAPGEMLQAGEEIDPATLKPEDVIVIEGAAATLQPPARHSIPEGGVLLGTNLLPAVMVIGDADTQLGRVVMSAFFAAGVEYDAWNAMPEAERDAFIVGRAREIGYTGELLTPETGAGEGAGAPGGGEGGGDASKAPPAPPAPPAAPGEAVSVFHEGFGRWFKADATGAKVGAKMTRAQAEAASLPIIDKPAA